MKTVAITGAKGFVGAALARQFAAQGWRVIKLIRNPQIPDERKFILGENIAPDILAGCDLLIHAAYDFSLTAWADIRRVNLQGSEKLFDAALRAGVQKQIFISSMAAFEGCHSHYGRGKLAAEEAMRARSGFSIRPGVIYSATNGGLAAKIEKAAQTLPVLPMIGSGAYPLYMCHLDDLCEMILQLAQKATDPPQPLYAACDQPTSLRALALAARDRPLFILPIPWQLVALGLWLLQGIGLRPAFRSDSVVSLVHANPAPDFTATKNLAFRPFHS